MAVRRRERSVVTTEIRPISLEIAFADDGQAAKGAHIVEAVFIDGEFMRLLPAKPLAESTVEAVADYAAAFSASVVAQVTALTAERDAALAGVQSVTATMQAEIDRLTALVPAPVADYMITPSVFVERLESASPGVIDRLWQSDTKEAGRLAVTLFTWSDRIDCRPGGRLEGYLNLIVQMGFMDADSVAKVLV